METDANTATLNAIIDEHNETLDALFALEAANRLPRKNFHANEIVAKASGLGYALHPKQVCSALFAIDAERNSDWRWQIKTVGAGLEKVRRMPGKNGRTVPVS